MRRLAVGLLLVIALFGARFDHSGGDAHAQSRADIIPGQYIVVFNENVRASTALTDDLIRAHGGSLRYRYQFALQGFAAQLSDAAAEAIRRNPNVAFVEPDGVVTIVDTQPNPPSWGLDRIDQHPLPLNSAYSYANTGAGVIVYIIDTGIRISHTDVGGRAVDGYDAVDGSLPAADCHGHGTHVAGTVGGSA